VVSAPALALRAYTQADEPGVLELLQKSLGWVPDEEYARFFGWKHRDSPFGRSPAWVATVGERIAGFRTFLRWEFEIDGEPVCAVRAVDTATHPDFRGQGVFSALTLGALEELRSDGVAFVFNTPNERSQPGYLKMGWQPVGQLRVLARTRSVTALGRLARARTPAEKWSQPCSAGRPIADVLADQPAVETLVSSVSQDGVRTRLSGPYLAWRYGFPTLAYRAIPADDGDISAGLAIFRVRRRGTALEAAICEELVPGADPSTTRRLLRRVLRDSGADYAVRLAAGRPRAGFVPVPGQGPHLMWKGVVERRMPHPSVWRLALGDVELF
jgi:GNAT superfamily N-acetyltransferase